MSGRTETVRDTDAVRFQFRVTGSRGKRFSAAAKAAGR
jgi:hypothetical protein